MPKISTQHLFYEENTIYWAKHYLLFTVNLWQTCAGSKKPSPRAEVCKSKETIQLCKTIPPPPLITPFMRHLGTLFTHCWLLSHHCFSSVILTLLFSSHLQVAIHKRAIFVRGASAGSCTTVGKPKSPLLPCSLAGSSCFQRALHLPDPPGRPDT